MNVSERKLIEDKIISIKYSTAWYLFGVMVTMFFAGFNFYIGIKEDIRKGNSQVLATLDTIKTNQKINSAVQTNINASTKEASEQLNLRLLRVESIISGH